MFVTDWQYCTFHRLGGVVYPSSTSDSLTAAACAWHATSVSLGAWLTQSHRAPVLPQVHLPCTDLTAASSLHELHAQCALQL
jgi:hypothetical protein